MYIYHVYVVVNSFFDWKSGKAKNRQTTCVPQSVNTINPKVFITIFEQALLKSDLCPGGR